MTEIPISKEAFGVLQALGMLVLVGRVRGLDMEVLKKEFPQFEDAVTELTKYLTECVRLAMETGEFFGKN